MQKKSNKTTTYDSIRPSGPKQPDSFIKQSYKNTISDLNSQKSSKHDPQPFQYPQTSYYSNLPRAHYQPYETIRPDAKSDIRPDSTAEYDTNSRQNNMQVESLGSRDVQNIADQAFSPDELRRKYQPVPVPQKEDYKEAGKAKIKSVSREAQAARDRLKTFKLEDLKVTTKGGFDNRYNLTKEYLAQCVAAEVDPLDYYLENNGAVKSNISNISNILPEVKSSPKSQRSGSDHSGDEGNKTSVSTKKEAAADGLYYNMDGSLDKRYKKNEIAIKIAEAKEKLSKIDTSKLKKTKDGNIDKRYKENKEYLELEKQCHEEYYV